MYFPVGNAGISMIFITHFHGGAARDLRSSGSRSRLTADPAARALADYRRPANSMFAASSDLIAAYDLTAKTLWVLDGSGWNPELSLAPLDELHGITRDADVMLAYGRAQLSFVRDGGTWTKLPTPFDSGHFRDAVAIGQKRFLVVASNSYRTTPSIGQAGIWSGSEWCRLAVEWLLFHHVDGATEVDVVVGGHVVDVVGWLDAQLDLPRNHRQIDEHLCVGGCGASFKQPSQAGS